MKKSIGIVRKVDELGRIVIPMEIRKEFGINIKDPIEIYTNGKKIIFEKYKSKVCKNCGSCIDEEDKFCRYCGEKI